MRATCTRTITNAELVHASSLSSTYSHNHTCVCVSECVRVCVCACVCVCVCARARAYARPILAQASLTHRLPVIYYREATAAVKGHCIWTFRHLLPVSVTHVSTQLY